MTEPSRVNLRDHPLVVLITAAAALITIAVGMVKITVYCTGQPDLKSLVKTLAKSKDNNSVSNTAPTPTQESNATPSPTQDNSQMQEQPTESLSPQYKPSQETPEHVVWYTATIENCTIFDIYYFVQNQDGSFAQLFLQPGYHTTLTRQNMQIFVSYDPKAADGIYLESLQTATREPTESEKRSAPTTCFEFGENGDIVMRLKSKSDR